MLLELSLWWHVLKKLRYGGRPKTEDDGNACVECIHALEPLTATWICVTNYLGAVFCGESLREDPHVIEPSTVRENIRVLAVSSGSIVT